MTDVGATPDLKGVEDAEEVINEGVEGGVLPEIEVIGVDAACMRRPGHRALHGGPGSSTAESGSTPTDRSPFHGREL